MRIYRFRAFHDQGGKGKGKKDKAGPTITFFPEYNEIGKLVDLLLR